MPALTIVLLVIGSYLFGNLNNALLISKFKKTDIRTMDSGNPGTMNMVRNFGVKLGALTLLLDAVKGVIPCIVGWYILGEPFAFGADKIGVYICGLSLILGHIFPVFLKFKGGKGIASSIGVCFVINPLVTLASFAVGILFLVLTKMGAATSFLIISVPIILEAFRMSQGGRLAACILLFCLLMLSLFAHRGNIMKLFRGDENKTVLFKRRKSG